MIVWFPFYSVRFYWLSSIQCNMFPYGNFTSTWCWLTFPDVQSSLSNLPAVTFLLPASPLHFHGTFVTLPHTHPIKPPSPLVDPFLISCCLSHSVPHNYNNIKITNYDLNMRVKMWSFIWPWFTSFNVKFSSFTHFPACFMIPFFFHGWIRLHCVYEPWFCY